MIEEKRITYRMQQYWHQLRGDQPLPSIKKFNPAVLGDVWPNCFQVSVHNKMPPTFTYEYMGEGLTPIYGHDMTGQTVDPRTSHFPGSVINTRLQNVVHLMQPMQDSGHLINYDGKMIRYRACVLPFGDVKDGVTHIICGITYRYF